MTIKRFILELEEGETHCDNCPINCDGRCTRGEIEKFGLDCDILNFSTMRIKELEEDNESK